MALRLADCVASCSLVSTHEQFQVIKFGGQRTSSYLMGPALEMDFSKVRNPKERAWDLQSRSSGAKCKAALGPMKPLHESQSQQWSDEIVSDLQSFRRT